MGPWSLRIVNSKYDFSLKEQELFEEMGDSKSGSKNIQDGHFVLPGSMENINVPKRT